VQYIATLADQYFAPNNNTRCLVSGSVNMDASSEPEPKRIERVVLACVQCRSRHVKCDATQPICTRCKRDGKECDYQKSRRGGLDKAALARRRLRLQQEAERAEQNDVQNQSQNGLRDALEAERGQCTGLCSADHLSTSETLTVSPDTDVFCVGIDTSPTFQINADRLLELYFDNFWPCFPFVLPLHHLQRRRLNANHGTEELSLVLQYVGSIYAPWTPSEPYLNAALQALSSPSLAHTPFNVQALMILAVAQFHSNLKYEGQTWLNLAVSIALDLGMNQREFAHTFGGSQPVLEESWRRTYYMLNVCDQHFAIVSNSPVYPLSNIPNEVDLPCDDEHFESGHIPPVAAWQDYENRELAEVEVVYSSIVYMYDVAKIVGDFIAAFLENFCLGEAMIERCDTKFAIWTSLLPASKRDPLRRDGRVDEVMFMAHMITIITICTMHRPFSSLSLCAEELKTQAFLAPTPFVAPLKQGRGAHTARTLKVMEMQTKLLAIPCAIEKHNVFAMCISAQLAVAQISACKTLLEDHALSIARDRVRLSIGFLNAMGPFWPLGKLMAKEVRHIARMHLSTNQTTIGSEPDPTTEIDFPRDDLIWPIDPSAQIDIYSGLMLPIDWATTNFSYATSSSTGMSREQFLLNNPVQLSSCTAAGDL
jgi:hypothetical protein